MITHWKSYTYIYIYKFGKFFFFSLTSGDWNPLKSLHLFLFEFCFLAKFRQLKKKGGCLLSARRPLTYHATQCSLFCVLVDDGWMDGWMVEAPKDEWGMDAQTNFVDFIL
jgi:hypothetical protein